MAKSKTRILDQNPIEYDGMVRIDFTLIPKGSIK